MQETYHFQARKNQRGIKNSWIDIVINYGDICGDKIVFGQKQVNRLLEKGCSNKFRKELLKISDKKGLVVVFENDVLITVYQINKNIQKIRKAS